MTRCDPDPAQRRLTRVHSLSGRSYFTVTEAADVFVLSVERYGGGHTVSQAAARRERDHNKAETECGQHARLQLNINSCHRNGRSQEAA